MRIRREWFAAVALLLVSSHAASAQGIARSFDQLQLLVRSGDTVTVLDTQGRQTSGKIDSLSATMLTLGRGDKRREFREADVTTVRQRQQDSLRNGALWGLATGAALSAVSLADCDCGGGAEAVGVVAVYGGLGAGIGVGVDALITRQRAIFQRAGAATRLGAIPLVGHGRRGATLAVTF